MLSILSMQVIILGGMFLAGALVGFCLSHLRGANRPILVVPFVPLHKHEIRSLALESGFKLKPQEDGSEDLNPYVYTFVGRVLSRSADNSLKPPKPQHNPNL